MSKDFKIERDGTVTWLGKAKVVAKASASAFNDYYAGTPYTAPVKERHNHRGEDPIFIAGQRQFFGAQGVNVNPALYNVILDCAGMVDKPFLMTASTKFRHLVNPQHFLRLHWPDMGVPPVAHLWWLRLARALPKRGLILAACVGGHGRTGTALALLALATQRVDTADEAITLIRSAHCERAIETKSQEQYIRDFAAFLNRYDKDAR